MLPRSLVISKEFFQHWLKDKELKLIIAGEYYDSPQAYQKIIDDLELKDHIIHANHYIEDSCISPQRGNRIIK